MAGNLRTINSAEMDRLLTVVEEATRSTNEGVKFFVEPANGSLRRIVSRRHHIVFGRRGSGKSSLLRKAAADLTVDRAPIAWVDLEPFKGHPYPDLLLSVMIECFSAFKKWLDEAAISPATRTGFWKNLFGKSPVKPALSKKLCKELSDEFRTHITTLTTQLHSADDAELKNKSSESSKESFKAGVKSGIKSGPVTLGSNLDAEESSGQEKSLEETYRRSKVDFLKRNIIVYQKLFDRMAEVATADSCLFLDDLYHLKKDFQPLVVDYFHSIGKGHRMWLKVGTIRHRSQWYVHGTPPLGMKLSDDADEIDLDLTLEKYQITKTFLSKILDGFSASTNLSTSDFLTPGGLDRLVLASGGVARDFLAIFRRSVDVSREKGSASKITAEDINMAAGEYDSTKRDEFKRDIYEEEDQHTLQSVFEEVRTFCVEKAKSNCFLINKEITTNKKVDFIHELVDLKLLHLIRSRVTVNSKPGKIYEAYMLDLSQYAGARKRKDIQIVEFWKKDTEQALRKVSYIFLEKT